MDAACTIQDSIHVFSLVHKYVSRILGTYHGLAEGVLFMSGGIKIFSYKEQHRKIHIHNLCL